MDLICNIVIIGILVVEACLLRIIMHGIATTRKYPVRVPEYSGRRKKRTPPGGYVNMDDTDLKKAKKGVKR